MITHYTLSKYSWSWYKLLEISRNLCKITNFSYFLCKYSCL